MPGLQFSDQSDHDGFDSAVVGVNWLVIIVGRLQAGLVSLFVESLECCVFLVHDGDDQLAVVCSALPAADYVITLVDVLVDHAVASHLEGEYVVAGSEAGIQRQGLGVLDSFNRQSRRHCSGQWYCRRLGGGQVAFSEVAKQSLCS